MPSGSQSHIVFVHSNDLWVVARDGGDARRLTTAIGAEVNPKFARRQLDGVSAEYVLGSRVEKLPRLMYLKSNHLFPESSSMRHPMYESYIRTPAILALALVQKSDAFVHGQQQSLDHLRYRHATDHPKATTCDLPPCSHRRVHQRLDS